MLLTTPSYCSYYTAGKQSAIQLCIYATHRWPRQLRAVALQTMLQPIAASAFAVVYLPKVDTSNTSYDTYVDIVNLNGFVQPVRLYH